MTTVRIIMRVPSDKPDMNGTYADTKLSIKHTATMPAITMLLRDGGIITARNIPKSATLNALTILNGRINAAFIVWIQF